MKRYIYGLLALLTAMLGAVALTACADDNEPYRTDEPGTDCFRLVVKMPRDAGSRAAGDASLASRATDAELSLNEFKVKSLHFYFYIAAGHDDATSASVYDYEWTGEFDTQSSIDVPLPANALFDGGLFGTSGTTCIVYAVANVGSDVLPVGTAKTVDALKATTISSTFDETKVQESFVMDGRAELSLDRAARRATGEITLARAAAKLTLSVDLPESITVTGTVINQDGTTSEGSERTYKPNAAAMHVWMGNGVKKSKINTIPVAAAEDALYSNELSDDVGSGFTRDESMEKYKYMQNVPFYSYPNKWEATTPDGNSYLTVVVPWTYTDDAGNPQAVVTYYRLAVQPEACCIERNMHYDMRVTIGRLGGTTIQEPTDMDLEWNYAIEWNKETLTTDIKAIRYLLLNNNYYDDTIGAYAFEMNNETSIEIPVGTSHDVEIAEVTMSWHDFFNNKDRKYKLTTNGEYKYNTISGYNSTRDFVGIEMDNTASKLLLTRELLNITCIKKTRKPATYDRYGNVLPAHYVYEEINNPEITTDPAVNNYTFDIKLWHKDDHSRTANVRIVQTPAIYITSDLTGKSKDWPYRFVNAQQENQKGGGDGTHAYVANPAPTKSNDLYIGDVWDLGSNWNTYVLTITKFDETEDRNYIVGDPRSREIDNLPVPGNSQTGIASWTYQDSEKTRLRYYYPTDAQGTKSNFIAPKIRIASQLGATQPTTRLGAKRRCAAYQENGRPAGRWRLPTVAEIEYIAYLSSNAYIPYLFGDATDNNLQYWCGSGAVSIDNTAIPPSIKKSTTEPNRTAVRCVYDEWYWGTDTLTDKTKFVWGDRPRTTSGN